MNHMIRCKLPSKCSDLVAKSIWKVLFLLLV